MMGLYYGTMNIGYMSTPLILPFLKGGAAGRGILEILQHRSSATSFRKGGINAMHRQGGYDTEQENDGQGLFCYYFGHAKNPITARRSKTYSDFSGGFN